MAKPRLNDQQRRAIAARFLAGESRHAVAAAFGVSERTVTSVLRTAGVTPEDRVAVRGGESGPQPIGAEAQAAYAALGPPPTDPLMAVAWMHGALARSAWRAMTGEPTEAELALRKELRETAKAMAVVTPQTTLHHATKLIQQDADELEKPGGPELEDAPQVARRSHRGAPRRGRPRQL